MSNFTINPRRFQLLCAPLLTFLNAAILGQRSDWHTRKFSARQHLLLTLFAHFVHAPSANALLEELNEVAGPNRERNLRQMLGFEGLEVGTDQPLLLNQSSFSRANAHRSYRLWRYCFGKLWQIAKPQCQSRHLAGLGQLVAVDGSLFDCLGRMMWAAYSTTSHKVRGHFFFDLDGLPDKLVLTDGKGSERQILREHLRPNVTFIFDRGYNDYALFAYATKIGAFFVTRPLKNAVFELVLEQVVTPSQMQKGIVCDQNISVEADGKVTILRKVSFKDIGENEWCYLTNRFDLDPLTIVHLYQYRWQIELFFWWIKRHLQLRHWYSECENGVLIQLYAALIAFLLLKLYSLNCGKAEFRQMHIDFVRWCQRHLFEPVQSPDIWAYLHLLNCNSTNVCT